MTVIMKGKGQEGVLKHLFKTSKIGVNNNESDNDYFLDSNNNQFRVNNNTNFEDEDHCVYENIENRKRKNNNHVGISNTDCCQNYTTDEHLNLISNFNVDMLLNTGIVNKLMVEFFNHENILSLSALESFVKLTNEASLILISGYIYVKRYVIAKQRKFTESSKFVKIFLASCFMAAKYINDIRFEVESLLFYWDLEAKEIYKIEKDILSRLNYNIDITNLDIASIINKEFYYLANIGELNTSFNKAISSAN